MLSISLSTASVLADRRLFHLIDSSTMLAWHRQGRRRISLAEARQRALRVLWACELRRSSFAEIESKEFQSLFGWDSK
jgi:hypothetical protein